ncbi:DUF4129 domain-containing protein [Parasediminibacterium sp. JCM 36343]|uniref:DUF4129 domain-containing protein n=1 Tax=Parasediminibacterium sp. JCM 36343 TaxID=3374279 RepID=UPI00397BC0A4
MVSNDSVTQKESHIYDSSETYFNNKEYFSDYFVESPLPPRASFVKMADSLKKTDDFWYISKIENFKARQVQLQFTIDSTLRADSINHRRKRNLKRKHDDEQLLDEDDGNVSLPPWTRKILWGVIISAFLFGVGYFLTTNKIALWNWNKASKDAIPEDALEGQGVDIFQLQYKELLQKALADKNYRLYIRIQYLQTIKQLSDKKLVQFAPEHTNFHYLQQLYATPLYAAFAAITRHYEYAWYGSFDVSEQAFNSIKEEITSFQNKITAK